MIITHATKTGKWTEILRGQKRKKKEHGDREYYINKTVKFNPKRDKLFRFPFAVSKIFQE
jgi:hypothetical protein